VKSKRQIVWLGSGIAALLLLGVAIFLTIRSQHGPRPVTRGSLIVYAKGGQVMLYSDEEILTLHGSQSLRQEISEDGKILCYDTPASGGGERVDLWYLDLSDSQARKSGGVKLCEGVQPGWRMSLSGRYVLCVEGTVRRYEPAAKQSEDWFSGNILLGQSDWETLVFGKSESGGTMRFFTGNFTEKPVQVAQAVLEYTILEESKVLFYTQRQSNGGTSLCMLSKAGTVTIDTDVTQVLDAFTQKNVYYLKQDPMQSAPEFIIDDPRKEADAAKKKPRREDYPNGWISRLLGDRQYQDAMEEYKNKQARDALRTEIDTLRETDTQMPGEIGLYAFDGQLTHRMADVYIAADVIAARGGDAPALVYNKREKRALVDSTSVTLEYLQSIRNTGGSAALKAFFGTPVDTLPAYVGVYFAQRTETGIKETLLTQIVPEQQISYDFLENPAQLLEYAPDAADDTAVLYAYTLTEAGLSEKTLLDIGVFNASLKSAGSVGAYYRKVGVGGKKETLQYYDGSKKNTALEGDTLFCGSGGGRLLVLRDYSFLGSNADGTLYVCQGQTATEIAKNVANPQLRGARVYYLGNWNGEKAMGDLCVWHQGESKTIDGNVSAIYTVWESAA
jgi:hypothetical protein